MADVVEDFIEDAGLPIAGAAIGGAVGGPGGAVTGLGVGMAAQGVQDMRRGAREQRAAFQDMANASRDSAAALRMQFEAQRRQADISNARSLRNAIRQARAARAAIVNVGANTGTGGSSGVLGGASSIVAQHGANIDFFNEMGGLNQDIITSQIHQANAAEAQGVAQARAGMAQLQSQRGAQFLDLGMTIFSAAGGFKTIFGGFKAA